jgi:16S rRNA (cytosine967-C5)-methyltransferase
MSARDHALWRIDQEDLPGWQSKSLRTTKLYDLGTRDADLAENIYLGTVKNLLHLRWLTEHYSGRTCRQIDLPVQKILAIALYQLRYLQNIPASTAVDQAIEQTRRFKLGKADAFVNAVLRQSLRQPAVGLPTIDQPAEYADKVLSLPAETFGRLARHLGQKAALEIARHALAEPPLTLRLYPGVTLEQLTAVTPPVVKFSPHTTPGFVVAADARRNHIADWHSARLAQPQDPTAGRVVEHLHLAAGQNVLDRCCGVGTKTLQIATQFPNTINIWAIDNSEKRIATLEDVIAHAGPNSGFNLIRVHRAANIPTGGDTPALFDRALLDVPCSNSGVWARRAEAKYRQSPPTLQHLAELQRNLLADTLQRIRVGGILVYSTCSIWPEENEQVVQSVLLATNAKAELLSQLLALPKGLNLDGTLSPTTYHDGGFVAVIRRVA